MLTRRDYQAISAAVAGLTPPPTASPIASELVTSCLLRQAVGGDMQEWLSMVRLLLGDDFIANIFRERPSSEAPLELGGTDEWSLIAAQDLWKLPKIDWIIPGEIPERSIAMLYGSSGVGKSFMAIDYALQVAQDAPVVYIAGEGEYGLRQRVAAWCKHHKKPEGRLTFSIGAVRILDDEQFNTFLSAIRPLAPRMVVVDTLARAMVGHDENSTRDMGLFVQASDRIKRELDCAVLILHHTRKDGDVERGSAALRGACDQIIKLSGDDDLITWEVQKTKDAAPLPDRHLKRIQVKAIDHGDTLESCVFVEAEKVVTTIDTLTNTQRKILDVLMLPIFANGVEVHQIMTDTQKSSTTVYRVLNELKQLALIEVDGKLYKLSAEGHKAFPFSHDSRIPIGGEGGGNEN